MEANSFVGGVQVMIAQPFLWWKKHEKRLRREARALNVMRDLAVIPVLQQIADSPQPVMHDERFDTLDSPARAFAARNAITRLQNSLNPY